ncbi:MAG: AsmA family protein, partial [Acidiferrobacterales bacterium]
MSKVGKYILVSLGVILVAIIILMVMASVFIDPNTYRQQVVELVKKQTGRDLKINGDVSLSLFPWLGVQFKEMKLDGPPGFKPADFASLRSADIRVAALPLLWGRVDIDQILIDGLTLNLVRNEQGRDNWTFTSPQPAEPKTPSEKKPAQESSAMAAIRLGSLAFKDSNILWQD